MTPPNECTEAYTGPDHPALREGGPPIERVGPWRLLTSIGSGGMGDVYLGERADGSYEAKVAVKLLRIDPRIDARALGRLRAERRILASLEHPNISRLIDGGELPSGLPWLVMEYIDGQQLDTWCAERKLDLNARIELLLKLCDALAHAHRRLVVHRDLKPSNILVSKAGEPKLLDFGIAKLMAEQDRDGLATAAGMLTPAYASPEQVMGEPISTATDIYQLGLVAYELLTGVRVQAKASTTTPGELKAVVVDQNPERPSDAAARNAQSPVRPSSLRGDLDTILLKAIRKEPARRYGSVDELAADLRRYLERRPISARPDSLWYRTQRFVQRNRTGVAAAAAVLALLAWSFVQERQLRDQAEQAALAAQAAQAQSERERARVTEALGFVERTLARASPTELGIDLKVIDLLEDAAERVRSVEDPGVQASLYHSLARTQSALGRPRVAEGLLREGLTRSEGRLDALDPQRIQLQLSLAELLRLLAEFSELEGLAGELTDALKATRGPFDSQTLQARSWAIQAVQELGDLDRALAMQDALIAEVEAGLGPGPDLVRLLHAQGRVLLRARRDEEAIATFRREVAVRESIGDTEPRAVVWAAGVPLIIDENRARYRQVLVGLDAYRTVVKERLGADAPQLVNADLMQLRSLWKLGDFDPAIEFGRNAIADAERRFGASHQLTLNLRGVHAQALGGSGRHAESLALLSAVRAEQEKIMGTAEPSVLLTMSEEAVQMAALGRHAEALAWLAQARARLRPDHIGGSWHTVPHELDLAEARILRVSGDVNGALAKVRSAFAGLTAEYGDEDALSFDAARELTRILALHDEAEEAATIHSRFPLLAQARPPLP
jgi:serine/threonine-protein kinase